MAEAVARSSNELELSGGRTQRPLGLSGTHVCILLAVEGPRWKFQTKLSDA
jgi:hypothetical protein